SSSSSVHCRRCTYRMTGGLWMALAPSCRPKCRVRVTGLTHTQPRATCTNSSSSSSSSSNITSKEGGGSTTLATASVGEGHPRWEFQERGDPPGITMEITTTTTTTAAAVAAAVAPSRTEKRRHPLPLGLRSRAPSTAPRRPLPPSPASTVAAPAPAPGLLDRGRRAVRALRGFFFLLPRYRPGRHWERAGEAKILRSRRRRPPPPPPPRKAWPLPCTSLGSRRPPPPRAVSPLATGRACLLLLLPLPLPLEARPQCTTTMKSRV
ncbi:unnamed protein product, partial [Scytosiphon promiscuus]